MTDITPSQIIQWIVMGIGLVGVWFRNQYKIERLEEINVELLRQKDALWKWIQGHEKDSNNTREQFAEDIAEMRGANLVTNEQFKQILEKLSDLVKRFDRLEDERGK